MHGTQSVKLNSPLYLYTPLPTHQGDTSNTFPCTDLSDNERGSLSFADQFKFSNVKLNFLAKETPIT